MEIKHVKGVKKCDILLYALSTCGWCRRIKKLLDEKGVAYSYVDVDLLDENENAKVMEEVLRWNPKETFPTIIINGRYAIQGYDPDALKKVLDE